MSILLDFAFVSFLYNPYMYYKCKHRWKTRCVLLICFVLVLFPLLKIIGISNRNLERSTILGNLLKTTISGVANSSPFDFADHSDSIQNPFEGGGNDVNVPNGVPIMVPSQKGRTAIRFIKSGACREKHLLGSFCRIKPRRT